MTTPNHCKPARPSNSNVRLSTTDSKQSPRNCHASARSRRTSSEFEYSRSWEFNDAAPDIFSQTWCRRACLQSRLKPQANESNPACDCEAVKWLEMVQQFFGFVHFPTEHLALDVIFGEVEDGESVLFQGVESGLQFQTGGCARWSAAPGGGPGFGAGADGAGENSDNRVSTQVEF